MHAFPVAFIGGLYSLLLSVQEYLLVFLLRLPGLPAFSCTVCGCREFGSQRPMDVRNAVYQTLYDTVADSAQRGLPIAGAVILLHPRACASGRALCQSGCGNALLPALAGA